MAAEAGAVNDSLRAQPPEVKEGRQDTAAEKKTAARWFFVFVDFMVRVFFSFIYRFDSFPIMRLSMQPDQGFGTGFANPVPNRLFVNNV